MHGRLARLAPPVVFSAAAGLLLAWDGMLTVAFTDYEREAEPAILALRHGHLDGFLGHLPAYGGSLIIRSPFALLPELWHGGALAVFRSLAVPCLIAAAVLGLTMWSRLARDGQRRAAWVALGLCVANPVTLRALEIGHPEELFGACLCAGAVLLALEGRPGLAGVLLGLAVANKAWAVLAIPPVLFAASGHRVRAGACAAGVAALVLAPMVLHGGAGLSAAGSVATGSGVGFTPQQVWWFMGNHDHVVVGVNGIMPGYRVPPGWLGGVGHLVVIVVGLACSALWLWGRTRRPPSRATSVSVAAPGGREDVMLLLALVMLLRCALDPWDMIYYTLPFLIALTAWEAVGRRRLPFAALGSTLGIWVTWELLAGAVSPDLQSAAFALWVVPAIVLIAWPLYAPASYARTRIPLAKRIDERLLTLPAPVAGAGAGESGRQSPVAPST